jgi:CheY-like chemotaxis protein
MGFWKRKGQDQLADSIARALERVADGLPLNAEDAAENWPPPLDRRLPEFARKMRAIRSFAETLAAGESFPEPLAEDSGFEGLATALNRLLDEERKLREQQESINAWIQAMLAGKYDFVLEHAEQDKAEHIQGLLQLARHLEAEAEANRQRQHWAEATEALSEALRGEFDVEEIGERLLRVVCEKSGALCGAFYHRGKDGTYQRKAARGMARRHAMTDSFVSGEGLLGQAVAEGELATIQAIPEDYLPLESALSRGQPRHVLLWPIAHLNDVVAAVELAALTPFDDAVLGWLRDNTASVGVTLSMATARETMADLLEDAQIKNEELKTQQEELKAQGEAMEQLNAELEEKNEAAMRLQAELEEKNELLERQQAELEEHNELLERQKAELKQREEALERASRYKSEFLANMSHELRTPLNSLLLLSEHLLDNEEGNLTEEQLESIEMIRKGGKDLLSLINDILDLSKIEAGQMKVIREPVELAPQAQDLTAQLSPLATKKGITLRTVVDKGTPSVLYSDSQRIAQILKNLISNAIKFTDKGGITVRVGPVDKPVELPDGRRLGEGVVVRVSDSGVGIPKDRQDEIFEAFQQGDGSVTRKYGGTGLGLAISRTLARRLGGELVLETSSSKGSTFALYLPVDGLKDVDGSSLAQEDAPAPKVLEEAVTTEVGGLPKDNPLKDDRDTCAPGDKTLLIIEDDVSFAKTLVKQARKKGFAVLAATHGKDGLALAAHFRPVGIVLDLGLPDMDGQQVITRLKADPELSRIPIHVVSARDRDPGLLALGVVDVLQKPLSPQELKDLLDSLSVVSGLPQSRLLVVEDDELTCQIISKHLQGQAVDLVFAGTGRQAMALLRKEKFDGMLLDLGLPDMSGRELLEQMANEDIRLPVIIHTGHDLDEDEYAALRDFSDNIVLKGKEGSKRLVDEVALFLHGLQAHLGKGGAKVPATADNPELDDELLQDKKVLLVDDDVRNAFALNKLLRKHGLSVVIANDGKLGLEKLQENPDLDIILMDIMMPVMDGYEAMRKIRGMPDFKDLPILALTAKAMPEDRQKCLDAGATDYLAKPIDIDKLLSLIKLYLRQH